MSMKNPAQRSRYRPGRAGKSPIQITIAPNNDGGWIGLVWQRGRGRCLWSTMALDQCEVHSVLQQWIVEHGYHKSDHK